MSIVKLKGMQQVQANINKAIVKAHKQSMKGLIESAIVVRRHMDKVPPKIPVDVGNLRASWFVVTAMTKSGSGSFKGDNAGKMSGDHSVIMSTEATKAKLAIVPTLIMGFSAYYGVFVHEKEKNYKRPQSGAYFFESALKANESVILKIIGRNTKL